MEEIGLRWHDLCHEGACRLLAEEASWKMKKRRLRVVKKAS